LDWSTILQSKGAGEIWTRKNNKPAATSVVTGTKLLKATEDSELFDCHNFAQIGSGNVAVSARPDITFAVSNVAKFCSKPTKEH